MDDNLRFDAAVYWTDSEWNGLGEEGTSVMSDQWTSPFASDEATESAIFHGLHLSTCGDLVGPAGELRRWAPVGAC